ncbi:MAG: cobyric acid synthase CobQ, partial [Oscillospiraceae bacterium]|nr:cobyric acid synthase CobQ [Oscillospiraceae bacterium]
LRESGLEAAIKKCASKEIPVFGICGGYQILGEKISDPDCSEGGGNIDGMGLLKCQTVFSKEKTRRQTSGKFSEIGGIFSCLSQKSFLGYEIHMGETFSESPSMLSCGGVFEDNIYGCYIHGIFDSADVSESIVKALYKRKNLKYSGKKIDRKIYKEQQYDLIADEVRKNIDMELLYKILNEEI